MSRPVTVSAGDVQLDADVDVPAGAKGVVVFAHGSGSSRRSPRNLLVAAALHEGGFGTVLFDLLTPAEARRDAVDAALRFDIPLLTERLTAVVAGIGGQEECAGLPVGLFGASTGAAATLGTAAALPDVVKSVVSRGGRPDLAEESLGQVRAPTLLIVGARDGQVIALNEWAAARLPGEHEMVLVPGATHLFEEPGTLEEVCRLAVAWFAKTLHA
ncbi:MAG TPA: alpha/beta hydrolase [Cryobacterium sp.]|nr:alpha/beta hydrolase [Cryobacterium sp.]